MFLLRCFSQQHLHKHTFPLSLNVGFFFFLIKNVTFKLQEKKNPKLNG